MLHAEGTSTYLYIYIFSDNFQAFVSDKLNNFLSCNDINWKYILPLSPWWGEFYERLICIVKSTLRKVLGKSRLNYEELSTIMTEVEGVTNTGSSTYLIHDDDIASITPSHLIIERTLLQNVNNSNVGDFDMTKDEWTTGRDHNVRGAAVRVIDNNGKIITLKRDCKR